MKTLSFYIGLSVDDEVTWDEDTLRTVIRQGLTAEGREHLCAVIVSPLLIAPDSRSEQLRKLRNLKFLDDMQGLSATSYNTAIEDAIDTLGLREP